MSLVEEYHAARKARLARMGGLPAASVYGARAVKPPVVAAVNTPELQNPEGMLWCYDLVCPKPRPGVLSIVSRMISAVAEEFGVSKLDMFSVRRSHDCARPRQVAMWLCRRFTTLTTPNIGRKFGRDHTTVLHAIKKIDELMITDIALRESVWRVKNRLNLA